VDELQALLQQPHAISACAASAPGANPELVAAYRLQRMLKLALTCVAYGALVRTESRGAHYRRTTPGATTRRGCAHAGHLAGRDTLPTAWPTSLWT
jgi:succinate dehydrogenase/fumarate reductase flavoprotein subunit